MKKSNKCNMCGQYQNIEVGKIGDHSCIISTDEFVDIITGLWPNARAKAALFDEVVEALDTALHTNPAAAPLTNEYNILSKAKELGK